LNKIVLLSFVLAILQLQH